MASLFKNNVLKDRLITSIVPRFDEKINIVKEWHKRLLDKSLLQKTETQCEQAFNDDFFVKILGYTRFPSERYTIEVKAKVETSGGQKPDAALGFFEPKGNRVQCVCEIKDANTSLDKPQQREGNLTPVQQGFKYKPQYSNCGFVIVTNFREIRLYRDTMHDYERFTLEELADPKDDYRSFRKFYYLFSADHFIAESGKSVTEELLAAIRIEQEQITKEFYNEYRDLRLQLIGNIRQNNSSLSFDSIVEKAQKILDRMVFIVFCEDAGLLPENKLASLVLKAENVGLGFSVWNIMKEYFLAVDHGNVRMEVEPDGYNGELFKPDALLDSLQIDDSVCKEIVRLGNFNYNEDLPVNILGHIFEQSITDIEELKTMNATADQNVLPSKRKKEGIYYTPEYIVDFIVGSTLGKHLEELEAKMLEKHKAKDDIQDKNYQKRTIAAYTEYLEEIGKITVLDLACGSGAFLVKVYDYLKKEHDRVSQILEELTGVHKKTAMDDMVKTLLHQNIYGVDLNSESVEITKLSLWLKTAQKGKKLQELKENIKCGNSLIDDSSIDVRAFDWQKGFCEILDGGGFDVIVGNPPYVGEKGNKDIFQPIHQGEWGSKFYHRKMDLFYLFFHRGLDLLKKDGRLGFITTNYFITADCAINLRKDLKQRSVIEKIANFNEIKIFEDAKGQHNMITILQKGQKPDFEACSIDFHEKNLSLSEALNVTSVMREGVSISYVKQKDLYEGDSFLLRPQGTDSSSSKGNSLLAKIKQAGEKLSQHCEIFGGVETGSDKVTESLLENALLKGNIRKEDLTKYKLNEGIFILSEEEINELGLSADEKKLVKKWYKSSDIFPYGYSHSDKEFLLYVDSQVDITKYPNIQKHFLRFRPLLISREQAKNEEHNWYCIRGSKRKFYSKGQYLVCPYRNKKNSFAYSDSEFFSSRDAYGIIIKEDSKNKIGYKFLLALLNSRLSFFWLSNRGKKKGEILEMYQEPLSEIPIVVPEIDLQEPLVNKVDTIVKLYSVLDTNKHKVIRIITAEYSIGQWPSKLDCFWELSFDDFLKALKLKGISLQKKQELMEYFEKQKEDLFPIADNIDHLQQEIDEMVFDLYGLTNEEKEVVRKVSS
ncbi:MAG: N-6 DNA methylase [Candidatus Peribacteraceae bacterium]|nr:N-6 DNA methylase [Candidatus Peribacteraceae bacterium]